MFSYYRQDFSLPDSIIYDILKNPSTPKVYQKLIKTCKYFFAKNSILVCHCLQFDDEGWKICCGSGHPKNNVTFKSISNISKSFSKIWIDRELQISPQAMNQQQRNTASWLSQNIYRHANILPLLTLNLDNQSLTLNELSHLYLAEQIHLTNVSVNLDDGSEATLDKILEIFTAAKIFAHKNDTFPHPPNIVENLIKIPHFSKITLFQFENASNTFDIEKFYAFLKEKKSISAMIFFNDTISEEYRIRLKEIVDEILETPITSEKYVPLAFAFRDNDVSKGRSLFDNLLKWYTNFVNSNY